MAVSLDRVAEAGADGEVASDSCDLLVVAGAVACIAAGDVSAVVASPSAVNLELWLVVKLLSAAVRDTR